MSEYAHWILSVACGLVQLVCPGLVVYITIKKMGSLKISQNPSYVTHRFESKILAVMLKCYMQHSRARQSCLLQHAFDYKLIHGFGVYSFLANLVWLKVTPNKYVQRYGPELKSERCWFESRQLSAILVVLTIMFSFSWQITGTRFDIFHDGLYKSLCTYFSWLFSHLIENNINNVLINCN
jgi:hypothetical protein